MSDLTTEILVEIRDELRAANQRLDTTNQRLDQVVQEQIRHATAIVALEHGQRELASGQRELASGQREVVTELKKLNERIDHVLTGPLGDAVRAGSERLHDHEQRIGRVERRVDALEQGHG